MSTYQFLSHLSHAHVIYIASITQYTKPKTYAEACHFEHWQSAIDFELATLDNTHEFFLFAF
jgi:hypothetical protein